VQARSLAVALWRRRWTALVVLVLTLAAAGLWLGFAPREYTAAATITASPQPGVQQPAGSTLEDTVAALANSRPVLQDVQDMVGTRRSLAVLQQEVGGRRTRGTLLIRITVTDADAQFARRVANAVADALPLHDPTAGKLVFTDAERATTPGSPSSPDVTAVVLIGVGAGIVLAILSALVRELLRGRVERADQLAELADVLGVITRPSDPTSVPTLRAGPVSDEFRRVRVALEFVGSAAPTRTIVVAPACPEPAAGWVAVNLACSLAEVQHRVLLIDADFGDRPRHPLLDSKADGLVEVLDGRALLAHAVVESDVPGVSVLPVGDVAASSPAPLVELSFHAMLALLSEDDFDVVLVHAAPLSESDDARVMAARNCLLMTVPAGRLRVKALRRETAELHRMRLRLVGTLLLARRRKR
jgi:Mrp family chromosome partitioning ATPase/capsular polysaccharide biosynthesis protein